MNVFIIDGTTVRAVGLGSPAMLGASNVYQTHKEAQAELCRQGHHATWLGNRSTGAVFCADCSAPATPVEVVPAWPELWGGDPACAHDVVCAPGGGVKCTRCSAWFCY